MDLREYLDSRYTSTSSDPDTYICPNPDCDDSSGHFKVWIRGNSGWGYCVKCGWPDKGQRSLYRIIAELEGMPIGQVLSKFGIGRKKQFFDDEMRGEPVDLAALERSLNAPIGKAAREAQKPENTGVRATKIIPPNREHLKLWNSWFPSLRNPPSLLGRKVLGYLRGRTNFSEEFVQKAIRKYHLRYAEAGEGSNAYLGQRFHGRVMIPLFLRGELVFFQGRSIFSGKDVLRYDSPYVPRVGDKPGIHPWRLAGDTFFGIDRCWGRKQLVMVEGPFDAMKVGDGALGLLGKGMTEERLGLVVELKEQGAQQIILWFDPDVPDTTRNKTVSLLKPILPVKWTTSRFPEKDAADMTQEQIQETKRQAQCLSYWASLGGF